MKWRKRKEPKKMRGLVFLGADGQPIDWEELTREGAEYTALDKCPPIISAAQKIASTISCATIQLLKNTDGGDKRVKDALSYLVDIAPSPWMTRSSWIAKIVMDLLIYGGGNSICQIITEGGKPVELRPIDISRVGFRRESVGYTITIDGAHYPPEDFLHFVLYPDKAEPWRGQGAGAILKQLAKSLGAARQTEAAFLDKRWKPSIIVKVDGMATELSSPAARRQMASQYIETTGNGEPWIIPSDFMEVQEVRPLSLSDIAIYDGVRVNSEQVAAALGIPPSELGFGDYKPREWNHAVMTTIRAIMTAIQQELTRKLLIDKSKFFRFSPLSLMDYDLTATSDVMAMMVDRGAATVNEYRDRIGLPPVDGGDELRVLENYIPADMAGKQKKLEGKNE